LTGPVISARQSPIGTVTAYLKARVRGIHSAAHCLPKAFIALFNFIQKLVVNYTRIIVHVFKIKLLVCMKCGFTCIRIYELKLELHLKINTKHSQWLNNLLIDKRRKIS